MAKEERIGNPNKNLVLRTSGAIKVLIGDKYYSLKYSDEDEDENEDDLSNKNSLIISTDPIELYITGQLAYPGDNKIIFIPGDAIYYTSNNSYYPFTSTSEQSIGSDLSNTFNNTIIFNGTPPFIINSDNKVIKNLNASYLEGYRAVDFYKKSDKLSFNELETLDGTFTVSNGVLTTNTISANNIISSEITGNINIGEGVNVTFNEEFLDGKLVYFNIDILSELYNIYKNGISETISFTELCSKLLKIVNSDYQWEFIDNAYVEQLLDCGLLCKIINIENWKYYTNTDGKTLYSLIIENRILEREPEYNKSFLIFKVNQGTLKIGSTLEFITENETYYDSNNQELDDICTLPENFRVVRTKEIHHGVVTTINDNFICVATDLETWKFKNSTLQNTLITIINNFSGETLKVFNVSQYVVDNDAANCAPDYDLESILNLSNYYISLNSSSSYLGPKNWITINSSNGIIETPSYTISSDGTFKTTSFENVENTLKITGNLETSAIKVNDDGTVTINGKTGTIRVEDDGTLKLVQ